MATSAQVANPSASLSCALDDKESEELEELRLQIVELRAEVQRSVRLDVALPGGLPTAEPSPLSS